MLIEQKWGFGMAPVKPEVQRERDSAVRLAISAIENLAITDQSTDGLSIVKGLFSRVFKQDQWDWFTVWVQLGRPGIQLARATSESLYEMRRSLLSEDSNEVHRCQLVLRQQGIPERLRNYPLRNSALAPGFGLIYILSTREARHILKIGYTNRSIEQRVKELNSATGLLVPYGVRAMWVVKDAPRVEAEIHESLAEYRIRQDREFFEIDFKQAFRMINDYVRDYRVEA